MNRFVVGVPMALTVALLLGPAGAQKVSDGVKMLEAARQKETLEGDLNAAIKQYSAIASKYAKRDRAVAAKALLLLAECYGKRGDAQAEKVYERVVREYGDQKEAVALARVKLGGNAQPGQQANRLVWSGREVDVEGAVSPDGRYLSYVDWDTGDLAIHEIATGQNRKITKTGNKDNTDWASFAEESCISRDGKQVAFSWFIKELKRYELRVASRTGDPNPRRLYDDSGNEWLAPRDWSPDGKWIAVMISRKDKTDRLGLVSVADGSLRILRSGKWPGDTRIFFSPDGKYLGYDLPESQQVSQPRDLYVFDLDQGSEIPIATRRGQDIMMGWSPDGKRLLFESDRTGSLALWALPFSGGKPQGAPELLKSDLGPVEPMGVTQSGALYYGVRSSSGVLSSAHIASFDFETGRISSERDVSQDYLESNGAPWWSPDGKQFIYNSRRGTGRRATYVYVIRSTETNQVIRELPLRLFPNGYMPDGRSLMNCCSFGGQQGAFRTDLTTNEVTPFVLDSSDKSRFFMPTLSPDGKVLYFARMYPPFGTAYAIFRRDLASEVEQELVRRRFIGSIVLSPDGKYIASACVDPSTNSRIALLTPTAGGEAKEVMRVPAGVESGELTHYYEGAGIAPFLWRPDSSAVLVRLWHSPGESQELWQVPVAGTPRKLASTIDARIAGVRLHPDGHHIAYAFGELPDALSGPANANGKQIWVLDNFLPALSAKK